MVAGAARHLDSVARAMGNLAETCAAGIYDLGGSTLTSDGGQEGIPLMQGTVPLL